MSDHRTRGGVFLRLIVIVACASLLAAGSANKSIASEMTRDLYYATRNSIDLPNGCAFVAHSGKYKTLADVCAGMLLRLDKVLKASWLKDRCDADVFRDLAYAAYGQQMSDWFQFIPIGNGRFLIKLVCFTGAYNWGTLIFAYDESRIRREPAHARIAHPLPSLIVFPRLHPAAYDRGRFGYTADMRDFDQQTAIIYHYDMFLGDGSGGIYAEYQIDKSTFIATMRRGIYKEDADHDDPYDFSRAMRPRGKDWHEDDVRNVPRGCLVPLKPGSLPKQEPAISCVGERAVLRP